MRKVKRRTFSGSVCVQEVFSVADNKRNLKTAEPRQRFHSEEERIKHREGIARRHHEEVFNSTFHPQSLYTTYTIDNEHEVHTFEEAGHMADLAIRRLKYANPDAQIMFYMGRGKSTNRIHFHMVSNGLSEETIRAKWKAGSVIRIERLREHNYYNGVDYGRDYTGLANYLFDHWTPEQGGHHYKATRNVQQPDKRPPTVIKRTYSESKPPRAPKGYKLVECKSNRYGYQYFKYVRESEEHSPRMKC